MTLPSRKSETTPLVCAALFTIALILGVASPARAAEPKPLQTDAAAFARGAGAWANNCVRCHNARDPMDFRDDQWKMIMSHMRIRAGLTGQESRDVLLFLQQSNSRSVAPEGKPLGPTTAPTASRMSGKALYENTCIACHGADGKGTIPGVPDLTIAGGRLAQPDDVLIKHVREGFQSPGSAMAMPPKGGNPNLTEEDVAKLVDYMQATFKP